jgi:hypothetical protein
MRVIPFVLTAVVAGCRGTGVPHAEEPPGHGYRAVATFDDNGYMDHHEGPVRETRREALVDLDALLRANRDRPVRSAIVPAAR